MRKGQNYYGGNLLEISKLIMETIGMGCQSLFLWKDRKTIVHLTSGELVPLNYMYPRGWQWFRVKSVIINAQNTQLLADLGP